MHDASNGGRNTETFWSPPQSIAPGSYGPCVASANRRDQLTATGYKLERATSALTSGQITALAELASNSRATEEIGGRAAQALLGTGIDAQLRARLVRATWDEVRHSEAFDRLGRDLGISDGSAQVCELADDLRADLREPQTGLEFAVLHLELEALALDVFRLLGSQKQALGPVADLYESIATDEASHVALGLDIVRHLSCTDRAPRIDLMFDVALRQSAPSNAKAFQDLLGRLGCNDAGDVAELRNRHERRRHHTRLVIDQRREVKHANHDRNGTHDRREDFEDR